MSVVLPEGFLAGVATKAPTPKIPGQKRIIGAISPILVETCDQYEINSPFRLCYFVGEICWESDQFCTTVEYASGHAYEGRHDLGNVHPGDGVRFKGRGLIQLTGRANYMAYGPMLGIDLISNPELAADPVVGLKVACLYWRQRKINARADADDMEGVRRAVNGGLNGLAGAEEATDRAFKLLGYRAD